MDHEEKESLGLIVNSLEAINGNLNRMNMALENIVKVLKVQHGSKA